MKKYSLIYADPAWSYRDKCNSGERGANHKYDLMSLTELKRLPVWDLADDNCMLAMWWVPPMPMEALQVMESWGFRLHNMCGFTWAKTYPKQTDKHAIGMGHMTRANTENMLFAVKGKMLPRLDASICQLQEFPRMAHSAKPPQFRDLLVRLLGDVPRIELFSRENVDGWDAWGYECDSNVIMQSACVVDGFVSKNFHLLCGSSDQDVMEIADQPDAENQEPVEVEAIIDNEPEPDAVEDEPEDDYSDKTIEQLHEEYPDTWQRTMIMLSMLFGRKEAYSHREIQFAGSALLTDGEMTGTIAEYENAKVIDEALTTFSKWNQPSPTIAHYLVCGMLDDYKYPANRTLTENIKLLERLHAGEEPALEPVSLDTPIVENNAQTVPEPETTTERVMYLVMSREWLRQKYMQFEEYSDCLDELKDEIIDKTIQAIDDINDEYSSNPDAPKAEEFIENFFTSTPSIRTYMNIRSLRAAFRNLVSAAIAERAAA